MGLAIMRSALNAETARQRAKKETFTAQNLNTTVLHLAHTEREHRPKLQYIHGTQQHSPMHKDKRDKRHLQTHAIENRTSHRHKHTIAVDSAASHILTRKCTQRGTAGATANQKHTGHAAVQLRGRRQYTQENSHYSVTPRFSALARVLHGHLTEALVSLERRLPHVDRMAPPLAIPEGAQVVGVLFGERVLSPVYRLRGAHGLDEVRLGLRVVLQVEEERECLICMSAPRAARFGCGHSACCEACAEILRTRRERCPVCRTLIREIVERGRQLGNAPTFVNLN